MNQYWYTILMNKKVLEAGIYYFSPISIIEGTLEYTEDGVRFVDTLGKDYASINDPELMLSGNEIGVGYGITKEELLEKYETNSLEEAKVRYFEDMSSISHIGFYIVEKDSIGILPVDLRGIFDNLNNSQENPNEKIISINLSDIASPIYDENNVELPTEIKEQIQCIVLDIDLYKGLLKSKTYDEIMEKLQKIYHDVELMNQSMLEEFDLLKIFKEIYQSFDELETIEEMKEVIASLRDYCNEMILKLDKLGETKKTKEAKENLYTLINSYEAILKINDLEKIHEEILKMEVASEKIIVNIAETYDKEKVKNQYLSQENFGMEEEKENLNNKILNVREIKSYFDQVIIGQEEAKKDVITAIVMNKLADDHHAKNSCLLVGPTGSGKTLIAETVSKYFDMPMEIIDTTQLTVPGYVGANIEDFLVRLLEKTEGNTKKAEEGIVVFDEIDKKGSKENDDISGKGVLNTLLSFIQGTTYNLKYNGRVVPFNTSKLTIFATGAFTDVAKAKKEEKITNTYSNSKIGFNANFENKNREEDIVYEKLETEDFVKYGNMPIEIIGRFSTIAQLSGHTRESLKKILTDSMLSPLIIEQTTLAKINIQLTWNEEYLNAVVEKALTLKTGARSLKNIVEKSIKTARWEALSYLGEYSGIHLTAETVEDNYHCELIGNDRSVYQLKEILEESKVLKRERKC